MCTGNLPALRRFVNVLRMRGWILLVAFGGAAASASAQVGSNSCSAAPLISTGAFTGTTVGATPDGVGACEGFNPGASPDVWYLYQPPCNGTLSLNTCGSSYDTLISVHTGCPGTVANTIACDDDCAEVPGCESLSSCLTASVTGGVFYRIRVAGFGTSSGAYQLNVAFTPSGAPPVNNDCANPLLTTGGVRAFCTNGATTDGPNNVACEFFSDDQVDSDIWYLYYPLCSGTATASLCGSLYDTKIAAYAGDSCDFNNILACNDDFCGLQSQISFPVTLLEPVLIRVGGYDGAQGVGTLTISCVSQTPPNDEVTSPTIVGELPYGGFVDTTAATNSAFGSDCGPFGADVFYTFFPPASCTYRIETCGSSYDTAIHLYRRSGTGYFLMACDLNGGDPMACESTASRIDAFLEDDEEYLIRFGRQGLGAGGFLGFLIDVPGPNHVLVVDSAAIGGATGRTWFNAIPNLNDALAMAQLDNSINEIWVAAGVYVPEDPNFDNSGTFRLRSNLAIYGGFAGYECDKSQRDPGANPTYLSGDPNDDLTDGAAGARKHVITATGLSNVTIDGFVIRRGNDADGEQGSAIYAPSAAISVNDCRFEFNTGLTLFTESTSAIYVDSGASASLSACVFRACDAPLRAIQATVTIASCVFKDGDFGTLSLSHTNAVVSNSTFLRNFGPLRPSVLRCTGNSDVQLVNCTAISNAVGLSAAAIELSDTSQLFVRNSLFWENTGGISGGDAIGAQDDSSFSVDHSIVQGGEALTFAVDNAQGTWDASNLDVDPLVTPDGHLQVGSPAVDAGQFEGLVFAQPDRDGEARVTALLDIGSDEFFDADSDGLPDYWESRYFGSVTSASPLADDDADTLTNLDEFARYGTNPDGQVIYVCVDGDDAHSGGQSTCPTADPTGPKRTISSAIAAADDGASIVLLPGVFGAAGNSDLAYQKTVAIVGRDRAAATTVDCSDMTPHRFIADGRGAVVGLTVTGGLADEGQTNDLGGGIKLAAARLAIDDCDFVGNRADLGGGVGLNAGNALFRDTRFLGNVADQPGLGSELIALFSTIRVDGELTIGGGGDALVLGQVSGPGTITVEQGARLTFGDPGADPNQPFLRRSVLTNDLRGTGAIQVLAGHELQVLGAAATVDLSPDPNAACSLPIDSTEWGTLLVDGSLFVRDATIRRANVNVRLGNLDGATDILNNDIRLRQSAAGYGGEFFVAGAATVQCNVILSEGDRFLDLDPDPTVSPRPVVQDNEISVLIRQGLDLQEGELLELRTRDVDLALGGGESGAYPLAIGGHAPGAGYNDTWALESLSVLGVDANQPFAGAKVNLTNRPGFVFQDPNIAAPEAIYVKTLALGPGAVLNTALQRLYYGQLVDLLGNPLTVDPNGRVSNGARITDIPLLGFSLKVINMEDDEEFSVRIRTRLRDDTDPLPLPNADITQQVSGRIRRVDDPNRGAPDVDGYMEMRTRHPLALASARSVAANGAFARAGEEDVTIEFDYLVKQDSSDANQPLELIVYLSDTPDVSDSLRRIATLGVPASGPGSPGQSEMASFRARVPRGALNFRRGTYVELELRGEDAVVWIDNFDPRIDCSSPECGDFTGNQDVDEIDYLFSVAALGQALPAAAACADAGFSFDGYADLYDTLAYDMDRHDPSLYPCGAGDGTWAFRGPGGVPTQIPAQTRYLIAGKSAGAVATDRLYAFDASLFEGGVACLLPALTPASPPDPAGAHRANGQLTRRGDAVYQTHWVEGIVRLDDASIALGRQALNGPGGTRVYIGLTPDPEDTTQQLGAPPVDVEWDADPNVLYVAPVMVEPSDFDPITFYSDPFAPGIARRYKAAARIRLTTMGPVVEELYASDPRSDSEITASPPQYSPVYKGAVRGVEVDSQGNVFVLSAFAGNANDWLLVYNADGSTAQFRLSDDGISAIGGFIVSSVNPDELCLFESIDQTPDNAMRLWRYQISRSAGAVVSLSSPQLMVIAAPAFDPGELAYPGAQGINAILTDLVEDPIDGALLAIGMLTPNFDLTSGIDYPNELFTIPLAARFEPNALSASAIRLDCAGLRLPISIIPVAAQVDDCPADINGDDVIDLADLAGLLASFGLIQGQPGFLPAADLDGSGGVDLADLAGVLAVFGTACP